jgi:hypothetical protein
MWPTSGCVAHMVMPDLFFWHGQPFIIVRVVIFLLWQKNCSGREH